jgi:hypothetical protein
VTYSTISRLDLIVDVKPGVVAIRQCNLRLVINQVVRMNESITVASLFEVVAYELLRVTDAV